jgi:asparagine synthase (glutamine-hydrolysing)
MHGLLGVFGPAADEVTATMVTDPVPRPRHGRSDEPEFQHGAGYLLGVEHLPVVDLASGTQPIAYPPSGPDQGRHVIAFSGEIYNRQHLRQLLSSEYGATFDTGDDAEIVAAAHYHWGGAAPERLRGMFAYILFDRITGRVTGARDRFGIKPLHYAVVDGSLFVASEKRTVLEFLDGTDAVDPTALSLYLTMQFVPEPMTMQGAVKRVPVGATFDYTAGKQMHFRRYWQPRISPARTGDPREVAERIRAALRDSVRAHLVADVPVGAFLSGGVDSTGMVALAREVDPNIHAFSVGFDTPGYSELEVARESARQLGIRATEVVVTAADVIAELPRIVWHLNDPVADAAAVPLYFLAREASRHVSVALCGEGADELFGGHTIYREPLSLAPLTGLPPRLRHSICSLARHLPDGVRGKSMLQRAAVDLAERYYGNARIFNDAEKSVLMRHHDPLVRHTNVTAPLYAEAAGLDDVSAMQHIDLHTWLPGDILTTADRMSVPHGLELRVPYLDQAVFDAAAQVPSEQKVTRRGLTKLALRRALRDVVPAGAADRPKLGLPTPTRVWLRGELGEWADSLMATSGAGEFLDLGYARTLLHAHRSGERDNSRKVWTVLVFCLWHALFIERSLDAGQPYGEPTHGRRTHGALMMRPAHLARESQVARAAA